MGKRKEYHDGDVLNQKSGTRFVREISVAKGKPRRAICQCGGCGQEFETLIKNAVKGCHCKSCGHKARMNVYPSGEKLNPANQVIFLKEVSRVDRYRRGTFKCLLCGTIFDYNIADVKRGKKNQCTACGQKISAQANRTYYTGMHIGDKGTFIVQAMPRNRIYETSLECGQCHNIFYANPYDVIRNTGVCHTCANLNSKSLKQKYHVGDILTSVNNERFRFVKELDTEALRRGVFQRIDNNDNNLGLPFTAILYNVIVGRATGDNVSKGNRRLQEFFNAHNIFYQSEKTFIGLVGDNGGSLRYDFYIVYHDTPLLIEYDGAQHFQAIEYFDGEEGYQQRIRHDHIKNMFAQEKNIPLIRFNYRQKLTDEFILQQLQKEVS